MTSQRDLVLRLLDLSEQQADAAVKQQIASLRRAVLAATEPRKTYTAWEQWAAWPICYWSCWWLGVWLPWARAMAAGV